MSFYLSTQSLSPKELGEASRMLRAGMCVPIVPRIMTEAISAVRGPTNAPMRPRAQTGFKWPAAAMCAVVGLVGVLFAALHPWPAYQWARIWDSESSYQGFAKRFPHSAWTEEAQKRMLDIQEPARWAEASSSRDVGLLRAYLNEYPAGPHHAEARAEKGRIARERWLAVQDSPVKDDVLKFIADFPDSDQVKQANRRLGELRQYDAFRQVVAQGDPKLLRQHMEQYPAARYMDEAMRALDDLAAKQWSKLANSESEADLKRFIADFPGTKWAKVADERIRALGGQAYENRAWEQWSSLGNSDSEAKLTQLIADFPGTRAANAAWDRLRTLYADIQWLRRQNSINAYRQHLELYPGSAYRQEIEIALQMAEILRQNPGTLPPSTELSTPSAYGTAAEVRITNKTGYELTVLYQGTAESRKVVIPVSRTQSVRLTPGFYREAASVAAANVRGYAGSETLGAAKAYEWSFVIENSLFPSFQLPTVPNFQPGRSRR